MGLGVGDKFPEVTGLQVVKGSAVPIGKPSNHVLVVEFWATWYAFFSTGTLAGLGHMAGRTGLWALPAFPSSVRFRPLPFMNPAARSRLPFASSVRFFRSLLPLAPEPCPRSRRVRFRAPAPPIGARRAARRSRT